MRTLGFFAVIFLAMVQLTFVADIDTSEAQNWSFVSMAAAQEEGGKAPAAPAPDLDIEIQGGERTTTWIVDPVVLLIGGGLLLLVVILIAFASRGGGTTIIREK